MQQTFLTKPIQLINQLSLSILLGLGIATIAQADTAIDSQNSSDASAATSTNDTIAMFKDYFQSQLTKELAALGVDEKALDAERQSILAEKDEKYALILASDFSAKYLPLYVKALRNMKISEETIASLLADISTPNLDGYLDIIRVSYRCNGLTRDFMQCVFPIWLQFSNYS